VRRIADACSSRGKTCPRVGPRALRRPCGPAPHVCRRGERALPASRPVPGYRGSRPRRCGRWGRRARAEHDAPRRAHSNQIMRPADTTRSAPSQHQSPVADAASRGRPGGRRGGTPIARARPFCVRPIDSMNSSSRTSPGLGLGICLVVIDDFDTVGASCCPGQADAPLPIDADAVLTCAVAFQGLQLVIRRHGEVLRHLGVVQHS
jgi:hypothetical protein